MTSVKNLHGNPAVHGAVLSILAATALLTGCVVRVAAPPPPPRVYVAPPPPPPAPPPVEYSQPDPGADAALQASEPPPPLPDYEQPPCPVDGYLWTPGYWAYAPAGYYWVPGTWVAPPRVGLLWTPGYWGFAGAVYVFHAGYWGPHVGFYGGVNYGFGYVGTGYVGGRWVGGGFQYNQAITRVNVTVVHNTYNETVINNVTVNRVSYNGGAGGVAVRPTAQERIAAQEPHVAPTPMQQQHLQQAVHNPALFAHANGGKPAIAATARPAVFNGPGTVSAHGGAPAAFQPPASRPSTPANAGRPGAPRNGAMVAGQPRVNAPAHPQTYNAPKQKAANAPPKGKRPPGEER